MPLPSADAVFDASPIIPVLTLEREHDAVGLARTLADADVPVMEITLRTSGALDAIAEVARAEPRVHLGVGTVLVPDDLDRARDAGATFAVSPGLSGALVERSLALGIPLIPGVATPSEVMRARESGLRDLKFFPAESVGGARMLARMAPVFADVRFVPTGGLTAQNAPSYLALANVVAIGGSWIVPQAALRDADWSTIGRLAREARSMAS